MHANRILSLMFVFCLGITFVPSISHAGFFTRKKVDKKLANQASHIDKPKHRLGRAKANHFGNAISMTREIDKKATKAVRQGKATAKGKGKFEVKVKLQDGTKATVRGRSIKGRNNVSTAFVEPKKKKKGWFW